MSVLAHLGNEDTGVATLILREILHDGEGVFKLALTLIACLCGSLLTVGTANNVLLGNMTTKDILESLADLTDGGAGFGSLY